MSNPTRGSVTFEADGKTYTLHYSTNALCELESLAGESVMRIAAQMADSDGVRLGMVRNLIWAGLRDHHPEVTVEDAGRIMDALGLDKAGSLVAEAFILAFPQATKAGGPLGAARAARNGTGRISARSGSKRAAM